MNILAAKVISWLRSEGNQSGKVSKHFFFFFFRELNIIFEGDLLIDSSVHVVIKNTLMKKAQQGLTASNI